MANNENSIDTHPSLGEEFNMIIPEYTSLNSFDAGEMPSQIGGGTALGARRRRSLTELIASSLKRGRACPDRSWDPNALEFGIWPILEQERAHPPGGSLGPRHAKNGTRNTGAEITSRKGMLVFS